MPAPPLRLSGDLPRQVTADLLACATAFTRCQAAIRPAVLWANSLPGKLFLIADADAELAVSVAGAIRVTRRRRQVRALRIRHRSRLQREFGWCGVGTGGQLGDRDSTPSTQASPERPDAE